MTLEEQIKCVKRELAMRRQVYPRLVAAERMDPDKAAHEMVAMSAVLDTLEAVQNTLAGIKEPKLDL